MKTTTYPAIMGDTDREPHGAFFTISDIKRANRDAGHHYFEPDTMRFFKSRVMDFVTGGRFFVTSEQNGYSEPRMWSVREAMPDGAIESYSEFQEYSSGAAAKRAAKQAAKERHAYYFDGQHGKGGRKVVYVVTGAVDPWHAMERLHKNFRIRHMGRAQDYMMSGRHADHYVKVAA